MVFKLKSSAEGDLKYTAKLESGNATMYYDFYGTKQELFSISAGEELDSHGGYVESGTVYIIVETDGACQNGDFQFTLNKEVLMFTAGQVLRKGEADREEWLRRNW